MPGYRILFLCLCYGFLFAAISQRGKRMDGSLNVFYTADSFYTKGLQLSAQPGSSEAEANRINSEALRGFKQFLAESNNALHDSFSFTAAVKAGELELYFDSFAEAKYFLPHGHQLETTISKPERQLPF